MATISNARQKELIALYAHLKELIIKVEEKYSPESRTITIDFPPTLGLQKLTYRKHTQSELKLMALQQNASKFASKAATLEKSYNSQVRSINQMREVLAANHQKSLAGLLNAYNRALENTQHKLVDNGLWYSTMKEVALADVKAEYDKKVSDENALFKGKDDAYAEKLSQLETNYEDLKAQLSVERQSDATAIVNNLTAKENREARAVEKYNASIDEKEAKYQASCQRHLRYAQQAEEQRVIDILKLYAQLGASGVEQRMKAEVLAVCRSELCVCTKLEASYIFNLDSFLMEHLGTYYNTLVDWAQITLRPDPA